MQTKKYNGGGSWEPYEDHGAIRPLPVDDATQGWVYLSCAAGLVLKFARQEWNDLVKAVEALP